jgi:hypothetical protein
MRGFIWLVAPLGWALACGGRVQLTVGENDATGGVSVGQGGSGPANGGADGRAGTSGKAGASHGGTTAGTGPIHVGGAGTIGGASSVGGAIATAGTASSGGSCACDPIACAPHQELVPNTNDCCYHCEPDAVCAQQLATYLVYRQPLLDKFESIGCKSDAECGYYFDANRCRAMGCGIPMTNRAIATLSQVLNDYSQTNCDPTCPPQPVPPCDGRLNAVCLNGRCQ